MVDVSGLVGEIDTRGTPGRTWQMQSPVRYSGPVTYSSSSNIAAAGTQRSNSPIQQVSYQSSTGSSLVPGLARCEHGRKKKSSNDG
ncbi:MAG: hypothetical protein U0936_25735 [Planctomycetaceae bacterium]